MLMLCVLVLLVMDGSKVSTSAFCEMMMSASRALASPAPRTTPPRAMPRTSPKKTSERRLIMTVSFPCSRVPEASRVEGLERQRRVALSDAGGDELGAHWAHPDAAAVVASGEDQAVHARRGAEERQPIRRVGPEAGPRAEHAEPADGGRDAARALEHVADTRQRRRSIEPHEAARAPDDEVARHHLRHAHALAGRPVRVVAGLARRIRRPGLGESPHVRVGLDRL